MVESVLRLRAWDGASTNLPAPGASQPWARATQGLDLRARAGLARRALGDEADLVALPVLERVQALSAQERYEEAGLWTARLQAFLRGAERTQRLRPLLSCAHLIAARHAEAGGWQLVCVRWGRLAGSARSAPGADPRPTVAALRATAQVVPEPKRLGEDTSTEETLLLADWVLSAGARLVEVDAPTCSGPDTPLAWPVRGAARHQSVLRAQC